jgi:Ca2+-binding RTX toxin-like protein
MVGGSGNDDYQFGPAKSTSQYTIFQQPNSNNDTVDFSRLPAADVPAQAADWISLTRGATAYSLCSQPQVGTVLVGVPGQQANIEYGLNIAPYLDLSGLPAQAVPGEPLDFRYVVVGTKMAVSSSVNWGDGTTTNFAKAQRLNGNPALVIDHSGLEGIAALSHSFTTNKSYTITYTVTNTNVLANNSTSATAKASVKIVSAMLAADPNASGQTALFVGTSQGLNNIVLLQRSNGSIVVVLSVPYVGIFTPSARGHVYVYATSGTDSVTLEPGFTHDAQVYTGPGYGTIVDYGSGNDRLYGSGSYDVIRAGSGNDIVYGGYGTNLLYAGRGNDVLVGRGTLNFLYGGLGRDLLIGGPGKSFLYGGGGDDLMVAGTTSFDTNDAALTAILGEWSSNSSFATRMGQLDGTIAGGVNGAFLLTPATVQSNDERNYLFAGLGQNWFFARLGNLLRDDVLVKKPGDAVTGI